MSTDTEQPNEGDPDSSVDQEPDSNEATEDVNPLFQKYADEAGRRFREALDELARFDEVDTDEE